MTKSSWTPKYPRTGFAVMLVIAKSRSKKRTLYPLRRFCKSEKEIDRYINEINKAFQEEKTGHHIKSVYVADLRFSKNWELLPEYWQQPGEGFDQGLRDKLFVDFLDEFSLRQSGWLMLITPETKIRNTELYSVPMPLRLIKRESDTEAFMRYSNWHVDQNATHAAMYTVENLTQYYLSRNIPLH